MASAASAPWNEQQRRNSRAEYQRIYKSAHPSGIVAVNVTVPDDIERREESSPCFRCESRGPCAHRPWMLRP